MPSEQVVTEEERALGQLEVLSNPLLLKLHDALQLVKSTQDPEAERLETTKTLKGTQTFALLQQNVAPSPVARWHSV